MNLNIKTEFNFLDSVASISDIVSYAKEKQMPFIGICDFATTFGFYKFYQECQKNNIKPIIGLELIKNKQSFLIYAQNHNGLSRLNELNTEYLNTGTFNFKDVEENLNLVIGKGIIIKEIINGDFKKLDNLNKKFLGNVYVGTISGHNLKDGFLLSEKIKENNLKYISISEVRFLKENDLETFITLKAVKDTIKVNGLLKEKVKSQNFCIKDEEKSIWDDTFINSINIEYPKREYKPPKYEFIPEGVKAEDYLISLSKKGLTKRLSGKVDGVYAKRLEYELSVIVDMGFADYFLIVWDIIKFAKANDIYVGPGRGSAAGSLVSYSLGITEINPIKANLLFERFLNPQRVSMPDIDIDFEDARRNEIVDYIIERFGKEKVCKIGTISRFLAKSTFRDVAKAWSVDAGKIDYI